MQSSLINKIVLYKKQLLYFIVVVIIGVAFYAYREYNRKAKDITSVKPAFVISADSLVDLFEQDESAANKKYTGKVIQVSGVMSSVSYHQDTLLNIILGVGFHKTSCQMDTRSKLKLERNQELDRINIKGICTGYLMDVELTRCVLIK